MPARIRRMAFLRELPSGAFSFLCVDSINLIPLSSCSPLANQSLVRSVPSGPLSVYAER